MSDGFEFKIETARLQSLVDNLTTVLQECIWEFREDELFVGAPEPANVAMVHQTVGAEAFDYYHSSGVRVGLNLVRLDDYLGKIRADEVEVTWDAEKRQLGIAGDSATLNMAAIDPDTVRDPGQIPAVHDDLPVMMTVEAGALDHAVDFAEAVSNQLIFDTDPERDAPFHVIAEGDVDDVDLALSNSVITADYGEVAESRFSIDYLEKLLGAIPTDAEVQLQHGTEKPTIMEWEFADGHAEVIMMVAPRI